jgi:hypothetical protein
MVGVKIAIFFNGVIDVLTGIFSTLFLGGDF